MLTRDVVESYLNEYDTKGEAIAALVEDFPELEGENALHNRPNIEVILEDLESYARPETSIST